MTVFCLWGSGRWGKLERNEFLGFIFQICDLLLEDGFDFHTGRNRVFFHKGGEIAQTGAGPGGAFACNGVSEIFLDVVADRVFGGSVVETNGHKRHL